MAKQNANKGVVLFKYDGVPTSTDVITLTATPFLSPEVKTQDYSEIGSGKLGQMKSYVDEHNTTVSFDLEGLLKSNNKKGDKLNTVPSFSNLFKACGLTQTIATNNVTYKPNHDYVKSSKSIVFIDDFKRDINGAVANMKITGTVGEASKIVFTVNGYTTVDAQSSSNPSVTLDSEALLIVSKVTAVTLDGTTLNIDSFEFNLGNKIIENYTTNLSEFIRTDFEPKITLTGIKQKGDETGWSDLIASSVKEIIIVLGSGNGKQFTLTATQAKTVEMSENDKDGIVNYSRTFRCQGDSSGDNHFSIKYH